MCATKRLLQRMYRHKWLILLCLASLALRLYKLDVIPYGRHYDEAGSVYDAWCIANYGVDRFGFSLPLFFYHTGGGGQSPMLTYLCAICIKIFGMNDFSTRLPGVFSSMLTLIFGLKIIRCVWRDEKPMLLYAFFFLIMPYFNMAARFGYDCNQMLGFSTMFLYFFRKATASGRLTDYAICGVTGGLMLATYTLSYIALPFFLMLMLIVLLALHKISFKQIVCFAAGIFPLALPLITMVIINLLRLDTLSIGPFTIPALANYRVKEVAFPSLQRLWETLYTTYAADNMPFNSLPAYWTMFYLSPVLAALGFPLTLKRVAQSLRARCFSAETVIVGWFLSMLFLGSMIGSGITCNRINGIYFVALYFVVVGAYQLILWAKRGTHHLSCYFARVLCVGCAVFYLLFGGRFLTNYLSEYKAELLNFSPSPQEAFDYVASDETLQDRDIHYYSNNPVDYVNYLIAALPDPNKIDLSMEDGGTVLQIGNVHFGFIDAIDENMVYILREPNAYWEMLISWNFSDIPLEDHTIYYME